MSAPPSACVVETILEVLARHPGREALIAPDGRRIGAGAVVDSTWRLARTLREQGVVRGMSVGLLSGSTPESVQARYAIALAGARLVSLYETTDPTVLAGFLDSTDCALLLVDPAQYGTARELLPLLKRTIVQCLAPGGPGGDLRAAAATHPPTPFPVEARPEDDWSVVSTGGTTGGPKGVRLSHAAYGHMVRQMPAGLGDPPRLLLPGGTASSTSAMTDITLFQGGTVVLQEVFDPAAVLAAVERERATVVCLQPPHLQRVVDAPELARTDVSSLVRILYTGCACPVSLLRRAVGAFGAILLGCYGQTEAGAISALLPHEHDAGTLSQDGAVSVGRPLPGVEVSVRDEKGASVSTGAEGEIWVRSPGAMSGYWKRDDLDRRVRLPDGWLRTGDLGRLDGRGHLFVLSRLTDVMFVSGGNGLLRVYPADLEQALAGHPAIAACAVLGAPGAGLAEDIHVVVVQAPGHRTDLAQLRTFLTELRGAPYAPAALHLLPELPLTARGKPDKRALRDLLGLAAAGA